MCDPCVKLMWDLTHTCHLALVRGYHMTFTYVYHYHPVSKVSMAHMWQKHMTHIYGDTSAPYRCHQFVFAGYNLGRIYWLYIRPRYNFIGAESMACHRTKPIVYMRFNEPVSQPRCTSGKRVKFRGSVLKTQLNRNLFSTVNRVWCVITEPFGSVFTQCKTHK